MKTLSAKIIFLFALLAYGTLNAASPSGKKIYFHDISVTGAVSGNEFGLQVFPGAGIGFGKRLVLAAGPVFTYADGNHTGYFFQSRYQFLQESESYSGHARLSLNTSFQQFHGAHLGANAVLREQLAAKSLDTKDPAVFKTLSYSGWECSMSAGFSYKCRFGLVYKAEAGFAYYKSAQEHALVYTLRENAGGSLRLGFGIGWEFGKSGTAKQQ